MGKSSKNWIEEALGHTYPSIFFTYPRLISLVHFWNRLTQLRNWYVHHALKKVLKNAPDGFSFLDIGVGEGMYLLPLSRRFPKAHFEGIEKAYSHILFCDRYRQAYGLKNISLCLQEIEFLSRSSQADIVICVGVLQYIEEDEQVLANMYRVLKPGGTLLLYIPVNGRYVFPGFGAFYEKKWNYEKRQGRKRIYTPEEIIHKVEQAHLILQSTRYSYGFWGKLTYEGYTYFLSQLIHGSWVGKLLGGVGMLFFLPFQLAGMFLDFILPNSSGNGLLLLARKE